MTITVEHLGGFGTHARYAVHDNGKRVATIDYYSHRIGWRITSVHYHEQLGWGKKIDEAKATALSLKYPTAEEVYEKLCVDTERARLAYATQSNADKMLELLRAISDGSNRAREEADKLIAEVDAYAKDRSDWRRYIDDPDFATSRQRSTNEPLYPKPPQVA